MNPVRILLDNSSYHLRNLGDVAMLEVALKRLSELWPGAVIQVLTNAPDLLTGYFPGTIPVAAEGRKLWLRGGHLAESIKKYVPWGVYRPVRALERVLEKITRQRYPFFGRSIIKKGVLGRDRSKKAMWEFVEALASADIVASSGGGFITDEFETRGKAVLELLGLAIKLGKRTAIFGQGIGPVESNALERKARDVLPSVDLIALREGRYGSKFLESIGVRPSRVMVTGDDAIETAYGNRGAELGHGIGINIRAAKYSGIDFSEVQEVGEVIKRVAENHNAPLVPIPISFLDRESDVRSVCEALKGDGSVETKDHNNESLCTIFKRIQCCHVVVTGSYHAGVFALAQGVSVVGLAKSSYYVTKFLGLADQFGIGCQVVFLNEPDWRNKLAVAINDSWNLADNVRPRLIDACQRQIEANRIAYARFYELVMSHPKLSFCERPVLKIKDSRRATMAEKDQMKCLTK
jgi:polysaccharide pyruvyl transferase WcaK-like protein